MTRSARLPVRMVEKVWGRERLPAPFSAPQGKRIGEVWFEPPRELDTLLVKYLFTSEKLSVQVHPSDAQAQPGEAGKQECWLVLDAEDDAQLAVGFQEEISPEAMRDAALAGTIESLLTWHDAKPGDFFYIPAGTVHAIGPGISLLEIQQNSDTTYRLFDYDRPRELHLDRGVAVARGGPHDPALRNSYGAPSNAQLVDGPCFRLDLVSGRPSADVQARYRGNALVIPLEGSVGIGGEMIEAGECGLCADVAAVDFSAAVTTLLTQSV